MKEILMSSAERGPVLIGADVDMGRFKEASPNAARKAKFLLDRGGVVLAAQARVVRIAHAGLVASIDAKGRVAWMT